MAKMADEIMKAIKNTAYVPSDEGLGAYHAANRVKAALRRKVFSDQLAGVREALNRFRVSAWADPDTGRIVLRLDGKNILTL